jgi:rubrerythrin
MQDTQTTNRDGGTKGGSGTSVVDSPVDDATYNVLQALTSKLEAIEAYELYAEQDDEGVFSELLQDERQHAVRLLEALRKRLNSR